MKAVEQFLYLLDEAFEGSEWHSLIGNLRSVDEEDWDWLPQDGHRSICDIVLHLAECKAMYQNYAFGDASLHWEHMETHSREISSGSREAMAWLRESHQKLRNSIAGVDDAGLEVERLTNWGEMRPTRWIVATMIEHDLYHAGEINHIRSLRQQGDRWEFDS